MPIITQCNTRRTQEEVLHVRYTQAIVTTIMVGNINSIIHRNLGELFEINRNEIFPIHILLTDFSNTYYAFRRKSQEYLHLYFIVNEAVFRWWFIQAVMDMSVR